MKKKQLLKKTFSRWGMKWDREVKACDNLTQIIQKKGFQIIIKLITIQKF